MATIRRAGAAKSELAAQIPAACADERAAVEFMERQRWGDTPCCPRCGDTAVYQMRDSKTGERQVNYRWRCRGCKQQFTVKVGTIMEDSPIPLRHWCLAFYRAASSKKGVSALQISRETQLSYKSALFMMHRIRWAMAGDAPKTLDGIVEIDETIIGGKRRGVRGPSGKISFRPARLNKTTVLAMVERDGRVRAHVIPNRLGPTLRPAITAVVKPSARIMTDDFRAYHGLSRLYAGHDTINHSAKEYARGDVSTNRVEGFFALLKRGIHGTFHSVSKRHLERYVAEFTHRYNHRRLDDGARMVAAIRAGDGRRLTYKEQTARAREPEHGEEL